MQGQWLGQWQGDWYGDSLGPVDPNALSGTAILTVSAVGLLLATGDIQGAAGVSVMASGQLQAIGAILGTSDLRIDANGTLTGSGGASYSAQLDRILAILTGRKVYDSATKTWHVYDVNDVELVDASGILLQGLHGWLLRGANEEKKAQSDGRSGYWRQFYMQLQEQMLEKKTPAPKTIDEPLDTVIELPDGSAKVIPFSKPKKTTPQKARQERETRRAQPRRVTPETRSDEVFLIETMRLHMEVTRLFTSWQIPTIINRAQDNEDEELLLLLAA